MSETDTIEYELVCGMEVHIELNTASKMFCGCRNEPMRAMAPNLHVCPVCLGMPGTLPVPNKRAIESTVLLGLALGCAINRQSKFDRKHYRYPDLPKGYQITQYELPFCKGSRIETSEGPVRLRRIHLEEDTAKLMHPGSRVKLAMGQVRTGSEESHIDFNRAGVPLIELVTEPDVVSPAQAKEFGKTLRSTVKYLGISGADLESGEMRLEASVSMRLQGEKTLPPYKVELKNINSFGFLEKAIAFEMKRQRKLLEKGVQPKQETRGFREATGETVAQRSKENADDYRYFPDPDIPPIELGESWIEALRRRVPELPVAKVRRWKEEFGIDPRYGELLCEEREDAEKWEKQFESLVLLNAPVDEFVKDVANKRTKFSHETPPHEVALQYAGRRDEKPLSDEEVMRAVNDVCAAETKAVSDIRQGNERALGFLCGLVLKRLGTKSGGERVRESLRAHLST